MKSNLTLSLVQHNVIWEDINKNISSLTNLISKIPNTDILLLPEMFNTGFCPKSTHLAEKMNGKTIAWMRKIAKEKKCAIAGTLMVVENKKIFNRLIWISKEDSLYCYDKAHLFSLVNEQKYITKGKERLTLTCEGWKICPLICYDLRFPVFSRNDVGYDLLIYLANWPEIRINAWNALLKARAIENQCYTIGVNRVGKDKFNSHFNGSSKVFNAFGKEISSANKNTETIQQVTINLNDLKKIREDLNFLQDKDKFTLL